MISSMSEYNIENPIKIEDNVFYYKKGYCLYTELMSSDYLYIINSGKVGIYNIVNSKLVTRAIYSSNNVIDGSAPYINYQPLSTTTVVLEDSKIRLLKKEEFIPIITNVNSLRPYYLKIVSTKIRNNVLKVMALNTNDISIKLLITIYYILRTETLFSKETNSVDLLYKISDIAAIIGYDNTTVIRNELKKIHSLTIDDDDYIHAGNIASIIREYETHKKVISIKSHHN